MEPVHALTTERMITATDAALPATYGYAYDGDGKRLRTTATTPLGTSVANDAWDITQPVPEIAVQRDGTGAVTRRFSYGLDRIATTSGGTTSFYNHDGIGSVSRLTSATGVPQWTLTYDPQGRTRTTTHDDLTAPDQPMRFAGEQLDPTGLLHLRARQLDVNTGRFTSTDPLAPSISDPYVSSYVYANDRPTFLIDPTGQKGRQPSTARTTIPTAAGYGTVRANLFIMAAKAGYSGHGYYYGDNRGFDPSAGPADSRASFRANLDSGQFNAFVNYSCKVGGSCKGAYPILLNPPSSTPACAGPTPPTVSGCANAMAEASGPNMVFTTPYGRGLKISYSLTNAATPQGSTPSIDGNITIEPLPGSTRVRVCASGDAYPSLEAYHDIGGTTVPVLQLKESSAGPVALFAAWPNRHKCEEG